ncbi:TapB family protein [Azospirillum sp. sgz301742]
MRLALLLVLALGACQTSGASGSQTAGLTLRCPEPGTLVRTSTGGTLEFKGNDGPVCLYTSGGKPSRRVLGLWSADNPSSAAATRALQPFELRVGNSVRFVTTGATPDEDETSLTNVFTVERTERVTVPAGSFDAVVINWNQRSARGYEHDYRMWYAPEIGTIVKAQPEHKAGTPGSYRPWEATEVRRGT